MSAIGVIHRGRVFAVCVLPGNDMADAIEVAGARLPKASMSRHGARMFATLDLATLLFAGVSLAVGLRNSTDQSYGEAAVMSC